MADGIYAGQGYGQPAYGQQQAPDDDGQQQQQAYDARPVGGKKKRAYAGQAYDFGAASNAGQAAQQPTAQFGAQPVASQYGAYPGQEQQGQQQPSYGQPAYGQSAYGAEGYAAGGAPAAYGQQQPQTSYGGAPVGGGYQAPQQGYAASGIAAVTQSMGSMGLGGGAQQPAGQPAAAGPPLQLNRLQTTDLISQPFHVSELDAPPPSIILPPNVGNYAPLHTLTVKLMSYLVKCNSFP